MVMSIQKKKDAITVEEQTFRTSIKNAHQSTYMHMALCIYININTHFGLDLTRACWENVFFQVKWLLIYLSQPPIRSYLPYTKCLAALFWVPRATQNYCPLILHWVASAWHQGVSPLWDPQRISHWPVPFRKKTFQLNISNATLTLSWKWATVIKTHTLVMWAGEAHDGHIVKFESPCSNQCPRNHNM